MLDSTRKTTLTAVPRLVIGSLLTRFFAVLLTVYRRLLSPYIFSDCRFAPSCSEYARQALSEYGLRGVWYAVRRTLRCTFWQGMGYDPVAPRAARRQSR